MPSKEGYWEILIIIRFFNKRTVVFPVYNHIYIPFEKKIQEQDIHSNNSVYICISNYFVDYKKQT